MNEVHATAHIKKSSASSRVKLCCLPAANAAQCSMQYCIALMHMLLQHEAAQKGRYKLPLAIRLCSNKQRSTRLRTYMHIVSCSSRGCVCQHACTATPWCNILLNVRCRQETCLISPAVKPTAAVWCHSAPQVSAMAPATVCKLVPTGYDAQYVQRHMMHKLYLAQVLLPTWCDKSGWQPGSGRRHSAVHPPPAPPTERTTRLHMQRPALSAATAAPSYRVYIPSYCSSPRRRKKSGVLQLLLPGCASELDLVAVLVLDVRHVCVLAALRPRLLVTRLAEVVVARVALRGHAGQARAKCSVSGGQQRRELAAHMQS